MKCVVFLATACLGLGGAARAQERPLTGCASETPPFVLMKNGKGERGFSVDLLRKIGERLGRSVEVRDLPWARCLVYVRDGTIDIAVDAYDDIERRKTYHYTRPYHTLTPQIFFRRADSSRWLTPTVEQLKDRRGCGVHEYTYEHYDIDIKGLDRGAPDDRSMLLKLKAARCDYAVEELEYIVGGRKFGKGWPDEDDLDSFRPSWARGPRVHFLVSRTRPDGDALLAALNDSIDVLEKDGSLERLRGRYLAADKSARSR